MERNNLPETVQDAYITWHYAMKVLSGAGVTFLEDAPDSEDLGDWVSSINTLLSFSPHPEVMWPDNPNLDIREVDPYGSAIRALRVVLLYSLDDQAQGAMSDGEHANLIAIEEFIRTRDNS